MKLESQEEALGEAFASLRQVPQPNEERRTEQRASFLETAHKHRELLPTSDPGVRHTRLRANPLLPHGFRRLVVLGTLVAIILALVVGAGGLIYAADEAVPGELLYGLDRAAESARLSLTSGSPATTHLLLSLAEERLVEAEALSGSGDAGYIDTALAGYGTAVSSLAQALVSMEDVDKVGQAALLDQAMSDNEAHLSKLLASEDEEQDTARKQSPYCLGQTTHPVAERLAETYSISLEDIRRWSCEDGLGFGEIMHMLHTSQEAGVVPQAVLTHKIELGGWGQVWQELGLIGPPGDVPHGPPAEAGPPQDKPGGQPDGRPVGPPQDEPGGSPEDEAGESPDVEPAGPPVIKPGGPPKDKPGGPPEEKPGKDKQDKDKEEDDAETCVGVSTHPVATKLAKTYDVLNKDIMRWFCEEGHGFGEIKQALKKSAETGVPAGELLER